MKESEFFRPIKEELERGEEESETKPLTIDEHPEADAKTLPALEHGEDDVEVKPMDLKDHWLSLRRSIQEKTAAESSAPEERERIKLLHELITPELLSEYKDILRVFNSKTKKSEEHPQRELIDVNNEELSGAIENWVKKLAEEVRNKKETGFDESDIDELTAQCWLFFDSMSNVMNTNSLERDISDFYEEKKDDTLDKEGKQKQKEELVEELRKQYPLDEGEIEILVDLILSEGEKNDDYSFKILAETIAQLWDEYSLSEKKGKIAKISLGYLMARGAESFAPSLFQNIMINDKFNVWMALEYLGLSKISEGINMKVDIELAKMMNDINQEINERITNSLFFQEFEFIHEKSLGEIYASLERGKSSTENMVRDVISKFAPSIAGISMSLAFLTKINPVLGAIGAGGLPIMYAIAKKQNREMQSLYKKEGREDEKIATRLGSIKSGFEEIKASPATPIVAGHVKEQMDIKDKLSLERYTKGRKNDFVQMLPFDAASVVAGGVGAALQEANMISGGAVLSSIIYSERLNRPIQQLVELYFGDFSRYVQDIQRMEEVLGEYEKLDLPEGEKENERIPISDLESFDISIKDLRYKNVLRGVNLDIKQGEFVAIAGASGAGKSTLLRNLVGLYKPDGGDIEIGGHSNESIKKYGNESIYSIMSYCNQNPQIFDGMTLRENLLLWSKKEIDDERVKEILKDLHLEKFSDKLDEEVRYLSGGERVRIGVARTLIKGAKIMLLDEPTASLDSQAATEVKNAIREISEKYPDTTIICVSHDEGLINLGERKVNMTELQK